MKKALASPVALQLVVAALCMLLVPGVSAAFRRSLLNAANCGSLGEPCCQDDSLDFFCDNGSRLLCDTVNVASGAAPACVSCGGDGETPCGGQVCDVGLGVASQSLSGVTSSICFNSSNPPCSEAGAPCCMLALQPSPVCFFDLRASACNADGVCVESGTVEDSSPPPPPLLTILPPIPVPPAATTATFEGCGTPGQACCIAFTPFSNFGTCFNTSTCDADPGSPRCLDTSTCNGAIVGTTCISAVIPVLT